MSEPAPRIAAAHLDELRPSAIVGPAPLVWVRAGFEIVGHLGRQCGGGQEREGEGGGQRFHADLRSSGWMTGASAGREAKSFHFASTSVFSAQPARFERVSAPRRR